MKLFFTFCAVLLCLFAESQSLPYYANNYPIRKESNVYVGTRNNYCNRPVDIRVNIYKPIGDGNLERPVVIFVPGGAFTSLNDQNHAEMNAMAQNLAKRGYVAVTTGYTQGVHLYNYSTGSPSLSFLGMIAGQSLSATAALYASDQKEVFRAVYRAQQDLKGVIRYIKSRHAQDSTNTCKFFISGHSAGAITCLAAVFMDQPSERLPDANAQTAVANPKWQNSFLQIGGPAGKDDEVYAGQNPAPFNYDAASCYNRPDLGPMDGTFYTSSGMNLNVLGVASMCGATDKLTYFDNQTNKPAVFFYHQTGDQVVPFGTAKPFDFASIISDPAPNTNWPTLNGSSKIMEKMNQMNYPAGHRLWEYTGNSNPLTSHDILPSTTVVADSIARFFGQVLDTCTICPKSNVLPIGMDFYVIKQDQNALLKWKTNSSDVSKFEIERSADGINFETIGETAFINAFREYNYNDNNYYKTGYTFYRIKEITIDGNSTYSRIQRIDAGNNLITAIYPNPAKDYINTQMLAAGNTNRAILMLKDATGRTILQQKINTTGVINIPVNQYSKGLYLLVVSVDGVANEVHKVIIE